VPTPRPAPPVRVDIKGIEIEAEFAPHMLYITNDDKPGFIGRFGTLLGKLLLRRGEALWWTYAYTTMFESIRQGRWETMSDAVAELTGRPPASLPQVLSRGKQPQ
jgi:hypothetical protein